MAKIRKAPVRTSSTSHINGPDGIKTRDFYRRTGFLWSDLYHTPRCRLHLTAHRPDLDEGTIYVLFCNCSKLKY